MKREDIIIRDPFVLVSGEKYYLYGSRSAMVWGPADGFDVYVSDDLKEFEGPIVIFHRPDDFFANTNFWAPECYEIEGKFYFLTTFGNDHGMKQGIYLMVSDNPTGPFALYSKRLTPDNWTCIDGTLYFENGVPYLVCSHTFEDYLDPDCKQATLDGDYVFIELSRDLKEAVGQPELLMKAKDFSWAKPIPFAKAEFGIDEDVYFSDGPFFMKMEDGKLIMINSSWSKAGYAVGYAHSENGIAGPWIMHEDTLFPENGGHGMFFRDLDGNLVFALHYPNDKYKEHPTFYRVHYANGNLQLGDKLGD